MTDSWCFLRLCALLALANLAVTGVAQGASVTFQTAIPDDAAARCPSINLEVFAVTSSRESSLGRMTVKGGEWQPFKAESDLPSDELFYLKFVATPPESARDMQVCLMGVAVEGAGMKRSVGDMLHDAYAMKNGKRLADWDHLVGFSPARVTVQGKSTFVLTLHPRFRGGGCELVGVLEVPPLISGKINYCRNASVIASSTEKAGNGPSALNDDSLARAPRWIDATPYQWPDTVDFYFLYDQPVPIEEVALVSYKNNIFNFKTGDYDVLGLKNGAWVPLGGVRNNENTVEICRLTKTEAVEGLRISVLNSLGGLVPGRVAGIPYGYGFSELIEIEAWGPPVSAKPIFVEGALEASMKFPREDEAFFKLSELPPRVAVSAKNPFPSKADLVVEVDLETIGGKTLKSQRFALALSKSESWKQEITFPAPEGGMYVCTARLMSGSRILAESRTDFGVECVPRDYDAVTLDLSKVKPYDLSHGTWAQPSAVSFGGPVGDYVFEFAKKAKNDMVCPVLFWGEIVPYRNCFNFDAIEATIEKAEKNNIGLEFILQTSYATIPPWLEAVAQRQTDPQGGFVPIHQTRGRDLSLWDPTHQKAWVQTVSEFVTRFGDRNAIKMWHFKPGLADGFTYEQFSAKKVFDYSPPAQAAFRRYLTETRGWSLAELNRRYGLHLKRIEDLEEPLPIFDLATFDLRPIMADYADFKAYTVTYWLNLTCNTVRRWDKIRPMAMWGWAGSGMLDVHFRKFAEHNMLLGYNSIDNPLALIFGSLARRAGAKWRTEITSQPFNPNRIDRMTLGNLAVGVTHTDHGLGHWITAWENCKYTEPLFHQLCNAGMCGHDVGAVVSFSHALEKSSGVYSWFLSGLIPGSVKSILNAQWSGAAEVYWLSDFTDFKTNDLSEHKLILEGDSPVMTAELIDALTQYVEKGGTLVLFGNSGRFERAKPDSNYPLLARLGWGKAPKVPETGACEIALGGLKLKLKTLGDNAGMPAGAKVLASSGAQPIVVEWSHGNGKVIRICGEFAGDADMKAFLGSAMAQKGIARPALAPDGISAVPIQKNGTKYVLVFNNDEAATRTATVKIHAGGLPRANLNYWHKGLWAPLGATAAHDGYFDATCTLQPRSLGVVEIKP